MKTFFRAFMLSVCSFFLFTGCSVEEKNSQTLVQNPFIPGYYADPSLVQYDGKFYLYATSDPWGTEFLACWVSDDFINWTFHALNWPTKEACSSPLSSDSNVWAPSVIQRGNEFFMYISVGSEIWCGKASHPLGPWENMLGDQPMLAYDTTMFYHVIDAEAFIDDDGRYYLYWGSGWNWTNGHCYAAELSDDMCSFKNEPVEVTPANYFEGPLMVKEDGIYYLTYSDGITMDDSYKVRYAIGDNPYGPFVEAENSPILIADPEKEVYGPGHHTVANIGGQNYILYHKHRLPFVEGTAYRQVCIDELYVNSEKRIIENIVPTNALYINLPAKDGPMPMKIDNVVASSEMITAYYNAGYTQDSNYQTLWKPVSEDPAPWIQLNLPEVQTASSLSIIFEYAWEKYTYSCEISVDGQEWKTIYQDTGEKMVGSPVIIPVNGEGFRYIRLQFDTPEVALWQVSLYK